MPFVPYEQRYQLPDGPMLDVVDQQRVVLDTYDRFSMNLEQANRLLLAFGAETPIEQRADGSIVLDNAGKHEFRLVKLDRSRPGVGIYERVPHDQVAPGSGDLVAESDHV